MIDQSSTPDRKRIWFFWGLCLTFVLFVPLIVGLSNTFSGISEQKATGVGAVAGGLAEAYMVSGVILAFLLPASAIVFFVKAFARGHGLRSVVSALGICWNVVVISLAVLFVWLDFVYLRRR